MAIFPFQPSPTTPYTFQPTLDGRVCTVSVRWNTFRNPNGNGWYIFVQDATGALIVSVPLVGSSNLLTIESASYDVTTSLVTMFTNGPHGYAIGGVFALTVAGCVPTAYNGQFIVAATGDSSLVYPVFTGNPGALQTAGAVGYNINLIQGYFTSSTLVYRASTGNFEVTP